MNYLTRTKDPTLYKWSWAVFGLWLLTIAIVLTLVLTARPHKSALNNVGGEKQYYPVNGVMPGSSYIWGRIER